jgi:hypothetical protein
MAFRVHLNLAAQFAQLQSSTTKFLSMLFGIVESKIFLMLITIYFQCFHILAITMDAFRQCYAMTLYGGCLAFRIDNTDYLFHVHCLLM